MLMLLLCHLSPAHSSIPYDQLAFIHEPCYRGAKHEVTGCAVCRSDPGQVALPALLPHDGHAAADAGHLRRGAEAAASLRPRRPGQSAADGDGLREKRAIGTVCQRSCVRLIADIDWVAKRMIFRPMSFSKSVR